MHLLDAHAVGRVCGGSSLARRYHAAGRQLAGAIRCLGDQAPAPGSHAIDLTGEECVATYLRGSTTSQPGGFERADAETGTLTIETAKAGQLAGSFTFRGTMMGEAGSAGALTASGRFSAEWVLQTGAAGLGLLTISALIAVVAFYRDDDVILTGILLAGITGIGTGAAYVVTVFLMTGSLGAAAVLVVGGLFAIVLRLILLAPVMAVAVWIARKFRRYLAPDTLPEASGASRGDAA